MAHDWLVGDQQAAAVERILDAAGACFAERGVMNTTIGDIAREAGCSRPTVYRYFDDRDALRVAFVHREARRIGARIAARTTSKRDPRARLVDAVTAAIASVRDDPILASWFVAAERGVAVDLAASSEVIEAMAAAFLGDPAEDDTRDRARWVVRVILSLLTIPGASRADERRMLERYLAPVVVGSPESVSRGAAGSAR